MCDVVAGLRMRRGSRAIGWLLTLGLLLAGVLGNWSPQARVLAADDPVACSAGALIAAINAIQADGGGTIELTAGCTYTLTAANNQGTSGPNGLPVIFTSLRIVGHGATIARSQAQDTEAFRFFELRDVADVALTLEAVTLANGAAGAGQFGGAILSRGGAVTLVDSTLRGNTTDSSGGAIDTNSGAVTLTGSTLSGNTANLSGGAIFTNSGAVTLIGSTLSGNTSTWGGAIRTVSGAVTLTGSTLSGNTAGKGGAIYTDSGVVTLTGSILAHDTSALCDLVPNGSVVDGGYNLVTDASCGLPSGDAWQPVVSLDELALGELAANGGPTPTIALEDGSVALNAIPPDACAVAVDQRGQPRPVGSGCDVGAFELQEKQATTLSAVSGAGTYGGTATLTATLQAGVQPLAGKTITFSLFGMPVGSATTGADGVAELTGVSLDDIDGGTHAAEVEVTFEGDDDHRASSASGPLEVAKVAQTITAFDAPDGATYGDGPFALSATATSGLAVTFTSAPSTACATSGQHGATLTIVGAGTCTITANQAGDDNWEAAPEVEHSFTVAKAPLTITASSASIAYGEPIPAITPSYAGFVGTDTQDALDTVPTCSTAATSASPVGSYPTTCEGAASGNYTFTYVDGTLTIDAAEATISLDPTPIFVDRTTRRATLMLRSTVTVDQGDPVTALPVTYILTLEGAEQGQECVDHLGDGGDVTTLHSACAVPGVPAGRYRVTASVGGNYTGEATGTVVVVDPLAGFVTGGGMVQGGMLSFSASYYGTQLNGAVSYQRTSGGRVALSTTRLTSFVRVGDTVYVEGEATLNGVGGHRVLLTAIDNPGLQRDQISLEVWDASDNLVASASFDLTSLQTGQVYLGPGF